MVVDIAEIMKKRESDTVNPSYAALSTLTLGRRNKLIPDIRTEFARDRDRIMYSESFYRLGGKTQVFMSPQNPLISNRMTHTLQVAQIARTIARAIGLNEDLVEAIAIGHDVGHPPFGHRGEGVLDRLCKRYLGRSFRHHVQSLQMLENVERGGNGLNLTYEVRDGIITHSGEDRGGEIWAAKEPFDWDNAIAEGLAVKRQPYTLEGCVVKLCDKIAYVGKDIEDAVSAGIITRDEIPEECARALGTTNGEIIDTIVKDIVRNFIHDLEIFRSEHGRDPKRTEIGIRMSSEISAYLDKLIFEFNYRNIYMSDVNMKYAKQTEGIIEEIFNKYLSEIVSFKKVSKEIPLTLWTGAHNTNGGTSPNIKEDTSWMFAVDIGTIEMALSRFQPGQWTIIDDDSRVKNVEILIELKLRIGLENAINALKDLRLAIIKDHIRNFSGGYSSILYFIQHMNSRYLRNTPSAAIVRDAIVSMTDEIALATFEAMRIPRPIV